MYINCIYIGCRKVWKSLYFVVFCPKNYEFQTSRLIGILLEYWKVDVNENVGISVLEFEKFISTLFLFNHFDHINMLIFISNNLRVFSNYRFEIGRA